MAKAAPPSQKGQVADHAGARYWLLERVATGGMAELFKARVVGPEGFDKLVAVKRILPAFSSNEEFVKMFIDEARLAANLNHPNIVQVFELGRDVDENLFISMELVNGVELTTLLDALKAKNKTIPEAAALEITIQVLRGLHHAHKKTDIQGHELHLVHRDVSPQNVLVTAEGVAKLLDFGVAKAKGRLTETQAGMVKGKLLYMSPEQSRNKAIDGRTDQFAAALMLWECLVGEPCYSFPTEMELLRAVGYGQVRTLESMGLEVAPDLESALMTALEPKPENRFPDCEEFANALLRYKQRNFPSFTPTMLGKLVSDSCGEQIAKMSALPDEDSPKAIPLQVADVEVSNFSSGGGSGRGKWYAVAGGFVGLLGLAGGGAAIYYNWNQPVSEAPVVILQAGAPNRTITVTRVVEVPAPPPPAPPAPPPLDCDAGGCDGGVMLVDGGMYPDGGMAPLVAVALPPPAPPAAAPLVVMVDAGPLPDGGTLLIAEVVDAGPVPGDAGSPSIDAGLPPAPVAVAVAATTVDAGASPALVPLAAVPVADAGAAPAPAPAPEKKKHGGPTITKLHHGGEIMDIRPGGND